MQMRNKKRTMGINKIGLLPQQPFVVSQSGAAASSTATRAKGALAFVAFAISHTERAPFTTTLTVACVARAS